MRPSSLMYRNFWTFRIYGRGVGWAHDIFQRRLVNCLLYYFSGFTVTILFHMFFLDLPCVLLYIPHSVKVK